MKTPEINEKGGDSSTPETVVPNYNDLPRIMSKRNDAVIC